MVLCVHPNVCVPASVHPGGEGVAVVAGLTLSMAAAVAGLGHHYHDE